MARHKKFKPGDLFAISTGTYLGEFFVYIKSCRDEKCFLSLPKMINRQIGNKNIDHAIEKNILEYQEHLPNDVKHVCVQQYEQNEKTIHRRK